MEMTQEQLIQDKVDRFYSDYNECARIAEGHGWPKKKKDTKSKKEMKK